MDLNRAATTLTDQAKQKRAEYHRKWAEENKDSLKEYQAKWRAENKDKIKEYNRRYWEKKATEQ